jgi:hypothetical protein
MINSSEKCTYCLYAKLRSRVTKSYTTVPKKGSGSSFLVLPGSDPGSVRLKSRKRKLYQAISRAEGRVREINKIPSSSYPNNYINLELDEKQLEKNIRRMRSLTSKIKDTKLRKITPNPFSAGFIFGATAQTKSLDRNAIMARNRSRSPNRRTVNRKGMWGQLHVVHQPIGSLPMAVKKPRTGKYVLRGANYWGTKKTQLAST